MPEVTRDAGGGDSKAIDPTGYACGSDDEDAGADAPSRPPAAWPCAERNGTLELCVGDAFDCAPSGYGAVAVASNGWQIALASITRNDRVIFALYDDALRPSDMVSFAIETGGFSVESVHLAAVPSGWILAYEAAGLHVLALSWNGSRVSKVGTLEGALLIRLAERPKGPPLLLVMRTAGIGNVSAAAVAIADDLSGFSKTSDLGQSSVRDGAFVGDGYLAVLESHGAGSRTSLQPLALDGTPVGDAVDQGTDLYRVALVAGAFRTHLFYTVYSAAAQPGFIVEVADDGTQLGEPRPLDPALNPEQGERAMFWEDEHVMLQRVTPDTRVVRIDRAQEVTTVATVTGASDGIPIGLVALEDRAVAVIVSQTDDGEAVTLAAVDP